MSINIAVTDQKKTRDEGSGIGNMCQVCHQILKQRGDLKRHLREKHQKPKKCPYYPDCSWEVRREARIPDHVYKMHTPKVLLEVPEDFLPFSHQMGGNSAATSPLQGPSAAGTKYWDEWNQNQGELDLSRQSPQRGTNNMADDASIYGDGMSALSNFTIPNFDPSNSTASLTDTFLDIGTEYSISTPFSSPAVNDMGTHNFPSDKETSNAPYVGYRYAGYSAGSNPPTSVQTGIDSRTTLSALSDTQTQVESQVYNTMQDDYPTMYPTYTQMENFY